MEYDKEMLTFHCIFRLRWMVYCNNNILIHDRYVNELSHNISATVTTKTRNTIWLFITLHHVTSLIPLINTTICESVNVTIIYLWFAAKVILRSSKCETSILTRLMLQDRMRDFDVKQSKDKETFVLFYLHVPAQFYMPVELGFVGCFQHFMHICHARHYSTLRNVHYWTRERKRD